MGAGYLKGEYRALGVDFDEPIDHLFQERQLRSVTANTRHDGEEFLAIAARIGIRVETVAYPLEQADAALRDLAHDRFTGAAVLRATSATSSATSTA